MSTPPTPDDLRRYIRGFTEAIAELEAERDRTRSEITRRKNRIQEMTDQIKRLHSKRARNLVAARAAGITTADLRTDTGLTEQRIRQLAPVKDADKAALSPVAPPEPEQPEQPEDAKHDPQPAPEPQEQPVQLSGIAAAVAEVTGLSPRPRPVAIQLEPPTCLADIRQRAAEAVQRCGGDVDAAIGVLRRHAIPHAMALLMAMRASGRYDPTAHPSLPDPLKRKSRKEADLIWEGRPSFRNTAADPGLEVTALDMNAAYLSAMRRVHLPIGRLVQDEEPEWFDPKRSGIYLIEPPEWKHAQLPNPVGDGRETAGPVWVSGPTLRLLMQVASPRYGALAEPPHILESWTSGCSESLLGSWADALGTARVHAIEDGDEATLEYIKAMYSKFVSTVGDSSYNTTMWRPDWVHIIRAQAFTNLWRRAWKARVAGLTVVRMSGTDELHVAGDWRTVFEEGRGFTQMKIKRDKDGQPVTYRLGDGGRRG